MVRLKEITPDNWRLGLKVAETQKSYVSNDMSLLARAYAYREFRSKAFVIYHDDCAVGMALYYDCEALEAYDLSQLFIDQRYQGHGYGIAVTRLILERMKTDGKYNKVVLCYIEGNETAKRLYEKVGFQLTGERDDDEIIMQLNL